MNQRERSKGNQTWSKGGIVKHRPQVNIAGAHMSSTNYHCSGQIHKWCFVANSETKIQSYTCAILLHLLNFTHGINIIQGVFIKMLIIGLGLAYQPWLSKDSTNQFNCHILSGCWSEKRVLESVVCIMCASCQDDEVRNEYWSVLISCAPPRCLKRFNQCPKISTTIIPASQNFKIKNLNSSYFSVHHISY